MKLKDKLSSILFPNRCRYCGEVIAPDKRICEQCKTDLPRIKDPVCERCGEQEKDCTCKQRVHYYVRAIAPFYYEGAVKKAIKRMKFSDRPQIAQTLAKDISTCIANRYDTVRFDLVTCVPMAKKELRDRGFNQSELIMKELKISNSPNIDGEIIIKHHHTVPQHSLNAADRRTNIEGAFALIEEKEKLVAGKTILLCDDVRTTGATANECAKVLMDAGAKEVYLVCAAIAKGGKR